MAVEYCRSHIHETMTTVGEGMAFEEQADFGGCNNSTAEATQSREKPPLKRRDFE